MLDGGYRHEGVVDRPTESTTALNGISYESLPSQSATTEAKVVEYLGCGAS
ncbi:MAG: hypothetical protein ACP5P1_00570 [Acidimicrobiales bacterium]